MNPSLRYDRQFFKELWQLSKPFWTSSEKWKSLGFLLLILICIVTQVRVNVAFNTFNKNFFDALQAFNEPLIISLLYHYIIILVTIIIAAGYNVYFTGLLAIRWRRWLTENYLKDWLSDHTYYRMQVLQQSVDNPDQRISEDLDNFPSIALSLFSNIINSVLTLVTFGFILWGISGKEGLPLGSWGTLNLPGYLLWACLFYAVGGTWLNTRIGRKLAGFNYQQQFFNADFRFGMMRLREAAEQVAMYRGEKTEHHKFRHFFEKIFSNFLNIIRLQKRLMFFENGYMAASFVFGLAIGMPLFFAKQIQIGGIMQISQACGAVITALSLFISAFTVLANWRSAIGRLAEFTRSMTAAKQLSHTNRIRIAKSTDDKIHVNKLILEKPDNSPLLPEISFEVSPGERVLVQGKSGIGKSTLLRALAGLWPYGEGEILLPEKKFVFLPQKPYLPLGTLRDALSYPHSAEEKSDDDIRAALDLCGLQKFETELDTIRTWAQELSLGEQQLIALARVFLQEPDGVFLDEATSALDPINTQHFYEKLIEVFPKITLLSVAHAEGLKKFHSRVVGL